MTGIAGNYQQILQRIRNAARRVGRSPDSIPLIAGT